MSQVSGLCCGEADLPAPALEINSRHLFHHHFHRKRNRLVTAPAG